MPKMAEMKSILGEAEALIKAARIAYPNADDETIKTACGFAVALSLGTEEKPLSK